MWILKIIIKIIISRLKIPYEISKKFNIFRHGNMENFEYSRKIFEGHFGDMSRIKKINNPVIMEIGPGDSLFSMVYSRKYSNDKFYLLDVKDFATKNLEKYYQLHKKLEKEGYFSKKLKRSFINFKDILDFYNNVYYFLIILF